MTDDAGERKNRNEVNPQSTWFDRAAGRTSCCTDDGANWSVLAADSCYFATHRLRIVDCNHLSARRNRDSRSVYRRSIRGSQLQRNFLVGGYVDAHKPERVPVFHTRLTSRAAHELFFQR